MTVRPIPEGYHTVTPYLMVPEAVQLIEFVKEAFDATELLRTTGSAGGIHAEVKIGDSMVMIGGFKSMEPVPAALYLYVNDVDSVYKRALQAGATTVTEPADQPDGDRRAGLKDAFGNIWYVATHQEDVSPEEALRRLEASKKQSTN